MYKSLILSSSAIVSIATLFCLVTIEVPVVAKSKQKSCVDKSPVSQRVHLTLKADKQEIKNEKIVFEPIVGKSIARPRDIIKYTVIAKNNSRCPLKNLVLKQSIPKGTHYLKHSAQARGAELSFSIDGGKTFVAKPKIANQEASTSHYNYIKWRFPRKISVQESITASYMLQVD